MVTSLVNLFGQGYEGKHRLLIAEDNLVYHLNVDEITYTNTPLLENKADMAKTPGDHFNMDLLIPCIKVEYIDNTQADFYKPEPDQLKYYQINARHLYCFLAICTLKLMGSSDTTLDYVVIDKNEILKKKVKKKKTFSLFSLFKSKG